MIRAIIFVIVLLSSAILELQAQDLVQPDTVIVQSGELSLKGLLWHPSGKGPFPGIIYCHGNYGDTDAINDVIVGPLFAKHGFAFLFLFRRGVGLSRGQGTNIADLMDKAFEERGQDERNKVQLQKLETDQWQDASAGLKFLKERKDVDKSHIAVVGVSLGTCVALLLAESHAELRAAILFSPNGNSWDRSPELRGRLLRAAKNISAPVLITQAANDYSLNPAHLLDSVMNENNKPHSIKIYPRFGNSVTEAHHLIFLSPQTWETDVFTFLSKNLEQPY